MREDPTIELTLEDVKLYSKKFGFNFSYSDSSITLRTYFSLKKKEDFGAIFILGLTSFPIYQLLTNDELLVQVVMGLVGGFIFSLSIVTLIKQHSDFFEIKNGKLVFRNSLKKTNLSCKNILRIETKKSYITIQRRNSNKKTYRLIELFAITEGKRQRFFDFSGEQKYQETLDQMGDILNEEINKKLHTTHAKIYTE